MILQDRLDEYKKGFRAKAPQDAQDIMQRATEALRSSGILAQTVQVGDMAPDFTLQDSDGANLSLTDLLDGGHVVLGFYRGRW